LAHRRKIEVEFMAKSKLQSLSGPVVHQGVVARLPYFQYKSDQEIFRMIQKQTQPLVLILDQIQDPHNLGAIVRTAEVAGITAIIIPEKSSGEINATVAKTSSGAIFHIPICRSTNLYKFLEALIESKLRVVAMVPEAPASIYNTDLTVALAIVIGSEGKGVRKNILKYCSLQLAIPGRGRVAALNASVSTAIVLFEALRQRGVGP
jgi:23S rRNA (guanosine2251-2'-O)-methyltransferase